MQLGNHLGNVLVTISDKKKGVADPLNAALIKFFEPVMLSGTDYYPFGMAMRVGGDSRYKYGFNGKENDNEVKGGDGLQQDYGMRVYDNRLGRFLSVDPLTISYPELTPYQFGTNNPILNIDWDGLEGLRGTFAKGIEFYPFALHQGKVPEISHSTSQTIEAGKYILNPHYKKVGDQDVLSYYLAARVDKKYRWDFIVMPEGLEDFKKSESNDGIGVDTYGEAADNLHYILDAYAAKGEGYRDRFMDYVLEGKGLLDLTLDMAAEEWKDPVNLVSLGTAYVATVQNAIRATPYKRPNNATTVAQRKSVQGKPCVTCGTTGQKNVADHKIIIVQEHYKTGKINKKRMRKVESVQPQCNPCSLEQSKNARAWAAKQRATQSTPMPAVKPKEKKE